MGFTSIVCFVLYITCVFRVLYHMCVLSCTSLACFGFYITCVFPVHLKRPWPLSTPPPLKRFRWAPLSSFLGHLKSFGCSFNAEAGINWSSFVASKAINWSSFETTCFRDGIDIDSTNDLDAVHTLVPKVSLLWLTDFGHHMHQTLSKWYHICVDPPPHICAQPWKRRPGGAAAFISNHKRDQRAVIASAQPFHGQNQKQRRSCVSVNHHSHWLDPCKKRVLEPSNSTYMVWLLLYIRVSISCPDVSE